MKNLGSNNYYKCRECWAIWSSDPKRLSAQSIERAGGVTRETNMFGGVNQHPFYLRFDAKATQEYVVFIKLTNHEAVQSRVLRRFSGKHDEVIGRCFLMNGELRESRVSYRMGRFSGEN
jgi:hypothetical protein